MQKKILIFFIVLLSCRQPPKAIDSDTVQKTQDSLARVNRNKFLSSSFDAKNFDNVIYSVKYSIGFDSLKNQKFYIDGFVIKDVLKISDKYIAKLSPAIEANYIITLELTTDQFQYLIKCDPDKTIIVFSITKGTKIDGSLNASIDDDSDEGETTVTHDKKAVLEVNVDNPLPIFIINGETLLITKAP